MLRIGIRGQDDFWTGSRFIALGGSALWLSRGFGSAGSSAMGPASFPSILGSILTVIGILVLVWSLFRQGTPMTPVRFKAVVPVTAGVAVAVGMFCLCQIMLDFKNEGKRRLLTPSIGRLILDKDDLKRIIAPVMRGTAMDPCSASCLAAGRC